MRLQFIAEELFHISNIVGFFLVLVSKHTLGKVLKDIYIFIYMYVCMYVLSCAHAIKTRLCMLQVREIMYNCLALKCLSLEPTWLDGEKEHHSCF